MLVRARHYRTLEPLDVECEGGVIARVGPASTGRPDVEGEWVAPALFDLQVNGCLGKAFASTSLTIDDIRIIVEYAHRHGVAGLCPTLITAAFDTLRHGFATLRAACDADAGIERALPCFHLEGPYLSAEDGPRGAHPREHVRPPDRDEFRRLQDAAGGRIRLVTLAPEQPGAIDFIGWLVGQGVVVALGHTAAPPSCIRDAVRAGARLSTHLGNGSHAVLPRHENYLWEQLAADELIASFIPDGHHLPDAVLRCLVRIKSPDRLIITCDASSLAGLPPGEYAMWGQRLEVLPEGKVVVPGTPFLAGSGVFTDDCVRKVLRLGEVSLADALDMAGARPRSLLGLPPVDLVSGSPADLILFQHNPREEFHVERTVVAGGLNQN